ncbi:MAG: hypothetical protein [Olavius algarvensis Gamma 1 endosymbiont]|nr:MAG: hypothetical protein [Olavius algarvensis Gamma 1 endosymbiont]
MSPERRAKGGLGCPVSHPEHGDTLSARRASAGIASSRNNADGRLSPRPKGVPPNAPMRRYSPWQGSAYSLRHGALAHLGGL